jgi:hypothetical protein
MIKAEDVEMTPIGGTGKGLFELKLYQARLETKNPQIIRIPGIQISHLVIYQ